MKIQNRTALVICKCHKKNNCNHTRGNIQTLKWGCPRPQVSLSEVKLYQYRQLWATTEAYHSILIYTDTMDDSVQHAK